MRGDGFGSSGSLAVAGSKSRLSIGNTLNGVKSGESVKQSERSDAVASYKFNGGTPNTRKIVFRRPGKLACTCDT